MPDISKISGKAIADISAVDGIAKANIASVSGLTVPSGALTSYVSTGLEFHVNSQDASSYTGAGATTWIDLTGNQDMSLINGPTKPSGEDFIAFDGADDHGEVIWSSGDYFFGSSTDYTFWTTLSMQAVGSFPEDGTTGYIHDDAFLLAIDRYQFSNMRGFSVYFGRRGIQVNLFYGSVINIGWPNTAEFQYNASRGYYEPIPDRVYSFALTMDRSSTPHLTGYLNGSTFTPSVIEGSATQVGSISTVNGTYLNNSALRKGNGRWTWNIFQATDGTNGASGHTGNFNEYLMYNTKLTAAEVQQNYDAYVDRYGPLN